MDGRPFEPYQPNSYQSYSLEFQADAAQDGKENVGGYGYQLADELSEAYRPAGAYDSYQSYQSYQSYGAYGYVAQGAPEPGAPEPGHVYQTVPPPPPMRSPNPVIFAQVAVSALLGTKSCFAILLG